jgi:hypothetical protein
MRLLPMQSAQQNLSRIAGTRQCQPAERDNRNMSATRFVCETDLTPQQIDAERRLGVLRYWRTDLWGRRWFTRLPTIRGVPPLGAQAQSDDGDDFDDPGPADEHFDVFELDDDNEPSDCSEGDDE